MTATVRQTAVRATANAAFELKSETNSLIVLWIRGANLAETSSQLDAKLNRTPGFFAHEPVLLELSGMEQVAQIAELNDLLAILRKHQLIPVAARGGSPEQQACATAAGLAILPRSGGESKNTPTPAEQPQTATSAEPAAAANSTRMVEKPIRTGQQAYAAGADLVVLGMVSAGAEVIADGSVHVYGPLRGRALAGVRGNTAARIFTQSLEAELVSIAGVYRTFEQDWGAEFRGKAVQIYLDGDKLLIAPLAQT